MSAARTARERVREELTRRIKEEARRQLAVEGAQRLSLRAVARELGMVSSAIYRYFPSRDDLLTSLIIDAYGALGDQLEKVATAPGEPGPRERWRALCAAVRDWARAHPHQYALVYGTPVPGYVAPQATIEPAVRVFEALAWAVKEAPAGDDTARGRALPDELARQFTGVGLLVAPGVAPAVVGRAAIVWMQLFGMVSFELFGHLAGALEPADGFFAYAVEEMADYLGLEA
ncbi:TetR/AcrR family transcriptional regulator [Streptomyces sp. NPDC026672]|uniref:TetR/AcrR family transcriptional regulator n=1 Tax=unclassified Streptomyces TaxID=2593676 RepID=UPI0033F791A2